MHNGPESGMQPRMACQHLIMKRKYRQYQLLGMSIIGYILISTYRVLLLQALDNLNLVNVYILVLQAS